MLKPTSNPNISFKLIQSYLNKVIQMTTTYYDRTIKAHYFQKIIILTSFLIFHFCVVFIQKNLNRMGQKDYEPSQQLSKEKRYAHILESFMVLIDQNNHPLSNISNFIALLKQEFNWWWIGFYFVSTSQKEDSLVLGPFQGPLACTIIKKGKGVCGTSWQKQESIIVQDVNTFQGHIACSSFSKSQIVIPLFSEGKVIGVLDVDSQKYSQFDKTDDDNLKQMLDHLQKINTWKWVSEKL